MEEFIEEELQRVAKYMEYPPNNRSVYVIQSHRIGKSQHLDFRFKVNNHLNGWSVVGGRIDEPLHPEQWVKNKGKGWRAEEKAVQPVEWLKVEGKVQPGQIGGGKEAGGEFKILSSGEIVLGYQSPYFHEYFLKDGKIFKDWTRVVIRGIKVERLDPETKKPIKGKYEVLWRLMCPIDQTPYFLGKRSREKKRIPPKDIIPFPVEMVTKEQLEDYLKYVKEITKSQESKASLSETVDFVLHQNSWMGPVHIRGLPQIQYFLRLDIGKKDKIRSFYLEDNPIFVSPVLATDEGLVPRKWFDYEGKVSPGERYNPLKELDSEMAIRDKGKVTLETGSKNGAEVIYLNFNGRYLKGSWVLEQEEAGSEIYTLTALVSGSKPEGEFVYQKHIIKSPEGDKMHYDLRIKPSDLPYLIEFNLYGDIRKSKVEGIRKRCEDPSWLYKEGEVKIGDLNTELEILDKGKAELIENTDNFSSFNLLGRDLRGYYTAVKREGKWIVGKGELPPVMLRGNGNPYENKPFNPPILEKKRGWDYSIYHLWDIRYFSRAEPEEKVKKYLPSLKIPKGVEVLIGLYPVLGTLPHAKVISVKFSDKLRKEDVLNWIYENKLLEWDSEQIKG